MNFIPTLTTKDWNEEWKDLQKSRKAADDAAFWDKKSQTFRKGKTHSNYADDFLKLADIKPGAKVLDMGCGNGALAIPLAREGHKVIAADFSRGMLDVLEKDASAYGSLPIKVLQLSWEDDWEQFGLGENCVDVALASRSIATSDLKQSLEKLSAVAKRKCAITLPTGSSPRADEQILSAIGLQNKLGKDFIYAIMILVNLGYLPEVQYIESKRFDSYNDAEDAFESLKKMIDHVSYDKLTKSEEDEAYKSLRSWIDCNLIPNPHKGDLSVDEELRGAYILKHTRIIRWAFISWDTTMNLK